MLKRKKKDDDHDDDAAAASAGSAENSQDQKEAVGTSPSLEVTVSVEEYETLKNLAAEFAESKEKLLRAMADFENSKKRNEKQKEEFIQYANKKIILEFLPIMDNLTRAIDSAKSNHSIESMIEGVDLINKQLQDILKGHGLEKIEAIGTPFDPHKHEAIGSVSSDTYDEDLVAEEIAPGYMYKDTLLRAAIVRVSSGAAEADMSTDDKEEMTGE